ncbi:MAG: type II toxin-antitoxin system HicB family antitoxin [Lachnospiraceae bacterium]|jgi:predicted RNase H-like HicB family nuclease|nr:type II toxin-antitoxin system HicB family antitoxin [Lachnospiraceae bacterium]
MYKYERIIYWSNDDNSFIVEVPELLGCMADGATIEEAIANVEIIIKEWIEVTLERGLEVPEPKGRLMYA